MNTLNFEMGSYRGYKGQVKPMIEVMHATGSVVRFFTTFAGFGRHVTTVHMPANPQKVGYAVASRDRSFDEAEELFEACLKKGYRVTENRPGE